MSSAWWTPWLCRGLFSLSDREGQSSFTATKSADPEELLYFICTMAFPVEGEALATINDVLVSALASSELSEVGRWRH